MTQASIKKTACAECGVDVRENTVFCYNCGGRVGGPSNENGAAPDDTPEAKAALDDLAEKLNSDMAAEELLAKAASERKKARVTSRRARGYGWEPVDDSPGVIILLVAVLVTIVAIAFVMVSLYFK